MKYLIVAAIIFIIGCAKEEKCTNRYLVIQTSERSASDKCNGLANSHPEYVTISETLIGCMDSEELNQAKRSTTTVTKSMCNGVTFEVKQIIK